MRRKLSLYLFVGVALVGVGCSAGGGDGKPSAKGGDANEAKPAAQVAAGRIKSLDELPRLDLTEAAVVAPAGAKGPTVARDHKSGAIYMTWAQEAPGQTPTKGKDPVVEIVVARSDDNGKTFAKPVVVSAPGQRVSSSTAGPAQVAMGPGGEVYVVYTRDVDSKLSEWGASSPFLVRSEDGGKTFSAPAPAVSDKSEGVVSSFYMNGLFVAADGDLFYSFLDSRESFAAEAAGKGDEGGHHGGPKPETHLRMARSADGGRTWAKSVLVDKPVCGCCSTRMAEGADGTLFVSTRAARKELKGSYDEVRDLILSISKDDGASWSEAKKVHDDGFKISGCPDVSSGMDTDSKGRLHYAWYTGTEKAPGVFYAHSDDGVTFSEPVNLLGGDWVPYSDVKLVVDARDQVWVAFEDRRGDVDQVRLVRLDDQRQAPAFATAMTGHGPDLVAGDDWALLTWETRNKEDGHDSAGGPVKALVARTPTS